MRNLPHLNHQLFLSPRTPSLVVIPTNFPFAIGSLIPFLHFSMKVWQCLDKLWATINPSKRGYFCFILEHILNPYRLLGDFHLGLSGCSISSNFCPADSILSTLRINPSSLCSILLQSSHTYHSVSPWSNALKQSHIQKHTQWYDIQYPIY